MSIPMRGKSLPMAVVIVFLPFLLPSARAGTEEVSVVVKCDTYQVRSSPKGDRITAEGFGRLLVPGKPDLPSRIFAVGLPPGAQVRSVRIEPEGSVTLPGRYRIRPCPLPRVTGEEDPAVVARDRAVYAANHDAVYSRDDPYPASPGAFLLQGRYRRYDLADVRVTPFTYHPRSGRLVYHPRVRVRIAYEPGPEPPDPVLLADGTPAVEAAARRILFNYDQARAWYPAPGAGAGAGKGTYDFVVITLGTLVDAVQPVLDWETAKGRSVKVVTTTWISYNYPGYDLQEQIRNFLRETYPGGAWGIQDVLLVGDYDDVPMRRVAQDTGYGQPETDFYYAELSLPDSQSWDKDGDHQWGEDEDPNDFYAEVNVGRIPYSDPETVAHICTKSAGFAANDDPAFKRNILLLGAYFWEDTDSAVLMELKTDPAWNAWMSEWTRTRLYEKNPDYSSAYPCDLPLLNQNAVAAWSEGTYAFVNWAGHGNPYGCHMLGMGAGYFIMGADGTCLNDRYPSIVFANACSNSDTDADNIDRRMLKQGAVGVLGATKVSWGIVGWSNPYDGCSSSMDFFFTKWATSGHYTQGAALQAALQTMYTYGLFYYVKYEMFEWSSIWGSPDVGLQSEARLSFHFPEGLPDGLQLPGGERRIPVEILPGLENYVPGTGRLYYRFHEGEEFRRTSFEPEGGNLYTAVLPATAPGDHPEFYFSAQGSGGTEVRWPYAAPEDTCAFDVGYLDVLVVDDFETESGWTVENSNVDAGAWERADPGLTSAQPDDDHSPEGSLCFVTGPAGGSLGGDDLDGGPTVLTSPALDLSEGDLDIGFYLWFHQSCYGIQQPLRVEVSGDDGATWTEVMAIPHAPGWRPYVFKVSDYVDPTTTVRVRFIAEDNPNDDVVEALVDDFMICRLMETPPLWADAYTLPVSTGGKADFHLDAGPNHAGRPYLLAGSLSGTVPGTPLPGGGTLPLNWDDFMAILFANLNTKMFQNFEGVLDGAGAAAARVDSLRPVNPSLVGQEIGFAYFLLPPPCFVSNPVTLVLVP